MLKSTEGMSLISNVADPIIKNNGEEQFYIYLSAAVQRILNAPPGERMAYMQLAMPYMKNDNVLRYPFIIREDLLARLNSYLKEFNLNPVLLVTGALLVETGISQLPATLPRFEDFHRER